MYHECLNINLEQEEDLGMAWIHDTGEPAHDMGAAWRACPGAWT